jgi:hypothetical protein
MHDVFPQHILGTQAFYRYFTDEDSQLSSWVDFQGAINERGIVISTATVIQISEDLTLAASSTNDRETAWSETTFPEFEKAVHYFRQQGCILPIIPEHEDFARATLTDKLVYMSLSGGKKTVPLLERIVLSTAIKGLYRTPLWLIDCEQPIAFPLLRRKYGLRIHAIARPAAEEEKKAS